MDDRMKDLITVCASCLCASCWQGVYLCENWQTAGTVQMTREELLKLDCEFEEFLKTDKELGA